MANHKSTKKRVRRDRTRTMINRKALSRIRTFIMLPTEIAFKIDEIYRSQKIVRQTFYSFQFCFGTIVVILLLMLNFIYKDVTFDLSTF